MVILEVVKSLNDKTTTVSSLTSKRKKNVKMKEKLQQPFFELFFRERETSLYNTGKSDRRQSSRQEGKLLYA